MSSKSASIPIALFALIVTSCGSDNPTGTSESVKISQVTCDKSAISVIDTVRNECIATSSGRLHYHWTLNKGGGAYTTCIVDCANSSGTFDFGQWIEWNPPSSGSWAIEVLAYLSSADHASAGATGWTTYYEYDQYGNVERLHCFNQAERGALWDMKSITRTVADYTKFAFAKHVLESDFSRAGAACAADLNGDSHVDVLGTAELADVVAWWENSGLKTFDKHVIDSDFEGATSVCAENMDGDDDLDVIASGDHHDTAWWQNDGSGNFTKRIIDQNNGAQEIRVADLDGDGDLDVAGAMQSQGEMVWWENDGSYAFTKHTIEEDFSSASSVYTADFNDDGYADIVGAATYGNEIAWWENDGDGLFTKHVVDADASWPQSVFVADLDGDTDYDIIAASALSTGDGIVCFENDGSNEFMRYAVDPYISDATAVYAIDMDNDTDVDIVAAVNDSEIAWWENLGSRNFRKSTIDSDFEYGSFVHAADIDGDGDVDVIGTSRLGSVICWWESLMIP